MAERLGPLEIDCDAPPYPIVRASRQVGLGSPEDVRWCRISHYPLGKDGWGDFWRHLALGTPRAGGPTGGALCLCGQSLPVLERITFLLASGKGVTYLMGQCPRCHMIFWEETEN